MSKYKLSRNEVISYIKPSHGKGDFKIHKKFIEKTHKGSKRLTRNDSKYIAGASRDGQRVTDREAKCIKKIIQYEDISIEAKRYLSHFRKMSLIYRGKRDIVPMSGQLEREKIQLLHNASIIPVEFFFYNKPYRTYKFNYLKIIARLLDGNIITMFNYKGQSNGVYHSKRDCLLFKSFGRKDYEVNSTIIHEATHAIQDMFDWDADRGHTEAAAHLTQAIWLLYNKKQLSGRLAKKGISDLANNILDNARNNLKNGHITSFKIKRDDYNKIKAVLESVYKVNEPAAKKSGDTL